MMDIIAAVVAVVIGLLVLSPFVWALIGCFAPDERKPGNWWCALGYHGPGYRTDHYTNESPWCFRTAPFERSCHCGAVWHGREVETRHYRTIGDWRRVK